MVDDIDARISRVLDRLESTTLTQQEREDLLETLKLLQAMAK